MDISMGDTMEFWKEEVLPVLPKANITIHQLQQIIKYVLTNSEIRASILRSIADQHALELDLECSSDQMEIDLHYSDESASSKASESVEEVTKNKRKKKKKKIISPKKDKEIEVKVPIKPEVSIIPEDDDDDVILLDDSDEDEPLGKPDTPKTEIQLRSSILLASENTRKSRRISHFNTCNSIIKPTTTVHVKQNKQMSNKSIDQNKNDSCPVSLPSRRKQKQTLRSDTFDNATKQKCTGNNNKVVEIHGNPIEVTEDGLRLKQEAIASADSESVGTNSISQPNFNFEKPSSDVLHNEKPSNQSTAVTDQIGNSSSCVSISKSKNISVLDSNAAEHSPEFSIIGTKENSSCEHSSPSIPNSVAMEKDESGMNVRKPKRFKARNEKGNDKSNSLDLLHSKITPTASGRRKSIPKKSSVQDKSFSIGLKVEGQTDDSPKVSKELETEKSSNNENLSTSGAMSKEVIGSSPEICEYLENKPAAKKELPDFATYKMQSSTEANSSDYIRAVTEDNCSDDSNSKSDARRNSFEDRTDKILKFKEKCNSRSDSESLISEPLTEEKSELGTTTTSIQHATNEGDGNNSLISLIPGVNTESKGGKTTKMLSSGKDCNPDSEKIRLPSEEQNGGAPRKRRKNNHRVKVGEVVKSVENDSTVNEVKTSSGNSEIDEKLSFTEMQHSISHIIDSPISHIPDNSTANYGQVEKVFSTNSSSTHDSEKIQSSAKEKYKDVPRKQSNIAAKANKVAASEAKDSIVKEVKTSYCNSKAKDKDSISFSGILHKIPQVIESPASLISSKGKEKSGKKKISSETKDCIPDPEKVLTPKESEAGPPRKQRKKSCTTAVAHESEKHSEATEVKTPVSADPSCSKDKVQPCAKTDENASFAEVVEKWISCMDAPASSDKVESAPGGVKKNSHTSDKSILSTEQKDNQTSLNTIRSISTNSNAEDKANALPEVKSAEKNMDSSTSHVTRLKTDVVRCKTSKCVELELPSFAKEMYRRADKDLHTQIAEVEGNEILEMNKKANEERNAELESVQVFVQKSIDKPVEDYDFCDKSAKDNKNNVKSVPECKSMNISVLQDTDIENSENLSSHKSLDSKAVEKKERSSVRGKASTAIQQVVQEMFSEDRVQRDIDHQEQPLSEIVAENVQKKQQSENVEYSEFPLSTKKSKENSGSNSQPCKDSHIKKKVKNNTNSVDKNACMAGDKGNVSAKDETSKSESQQTCQNKSAEIIEKSVTKSLVTGETAKENSPAIFDTNPEVEAQAMSKQRDGKRSAAASDTASEATAKIPKVCGSEAKEKFLKWNREQDKEILTTCNKKGSEEGTFESLAKTSLFHPRSAAEIKSRFEQLLNIYKKALLSGALKKSQK